MSLISVSQIKEILNKVSHTDDRHIAKDVSLPVDAVRYVKHTYGLPFRKKYTDYPFFCLDYKDIPFLLLITVIAFSVGLKVTCPILYPGDSGELVAATTTLGNGHPTGYPVYHILSKLVTVLLPLGNIGFRANLFSLLIAVIGVLLITVLGIVYTGSRLVSCFWGFVFAAGGLFLSQTAVAEVYTMQVTLTVGFLLLLTALSRGTVKRGWWLLCFYFGLMLSHHLMSVLLIPGLIFFLIRRRKIIFRDAVFNLTGGLFLIIGLSTYLYLPIRAVNNELIDWGHPFNLGNFWDHVTGVAYHNKMFTGGLKQIIENLFVFVTILMENYTAVFTVMLVIGLVVLALQKRSQFWLLLLLITGSLFYNTNYDIIDIEVYYLPVIVILFIPLFHVSGWIAQKYRQRAKNGFLRSFSYPLILALFIIGFFTPLVKGFHSIDRSRHYIAYDYAKCLLNATDHKGTIFCMGDNQVFPLAFMQVVENYRPDVKIFHRSGLLFEDIYYFSTFNKNAKKPIIQSEIESLYIKSVHEPVYFTERRSMEDIPGWRIIDVGMAYSVWPVDKKYLDTLDPWKYCQIRGLEDDSINKTEYLTEYISTKFQLRKAEKMLAQGYGPEVAQAIKAAAESGKNIGKAQYNLGYMFEEQGKPEEAIAYYQKAIELEPDLIPAYQQLGAIYENQGQYDKALKLYFEALEVAPENYEVILRIGYVYELAQNFPQAISFYRRAVKLNPQSVDAHNNLGAALGRVQEYDEAVRELQAALALDPDSVKARNNLGVIFNFLGKFDFAIEQLEKVIELKPNYAEAYVNLADACYFSKNYDRAIRNYKKAVEQNDKLALAHYNLGNILIYEKGRKDEGLVHWNRFMELLPNHPQVATIRSEIQRLEGE